MPDAIEDTRRAVEAEVLALAKQSFGAGQRAVWHGMALFEETGSLKQSVDGGPLRAAIQAHALAVLEEAHAGHLREDALSPCGCLALRERLAGKEME